MCCVVRFLYCFVGVVGILGTTGAQAIEFGVPIVDLGGTLHTGNETSSMAGGLGGFLSFRTQPKKGILRFSFGGEVAFSSGSAYLGSSRPGAVLLGGGVLTGIHFYPFVASAISPFLGIDGFGGWYLLRLSSSSASLRENTSSIAYGYELSAGFDLRPGSLSRNGLRLRTSYFFGRSTLGEINGFQLDGFRISIGIHFSGGR